jgi:glyoxylase-like metal-dependent hydrolase (beta-lactamase superfamily II)
MSPRPRAHPARYTIDADLEPQVTAVYLRTAGDECAFIEAHTSHALTRLLGELAARGRRVEEVRWVVVTHAHLDHAAGAGALLARCPNATLLAHPSAAKNLVDPSKLIAGAKHVYGEARFAQLYGSVAPIPAERVRKLADGDSFELGGHPLRVRHTAGHAWHHFVVEDPALDTVYTGDAFGLVYPELQRAGRFAIASTSPTGFDAAEAHKSVDLIVGTGASTAHFDAVDDLAQTASQLHGWIDRAGRWVEELAKGDEPIDAVTRILEGKIRLALAEDSQRRGLALTASDWHRLALDIELNAQGLAYAAATRRSAAD